MAHNARARDVATLLAGMPEDARTALGRRLGGQGRRAASAAAAAAGPQRDGGRAAKAASVPADEAAALRAAGQAQYRLQQLRTEQEEKRTLHQVEKHRLEADLLHVMATTEVECVDLGDLAPGQYLRRFETAKPNAPTETSLHAAVQQVDLIKGMAQYLNRFHATYGTYLTGRRCRGTDDISVAVTQGIERAAKCRDLEELDFLFIDDDGAPPSATDASAAPAVNRQGPGPTTPPPAAAAGARRRRPRARPGRPHHSKPFHT